MPPSFDFDQYGVPLPSITTLRTFTLGFLVFWSFGALIAFSLAGERLPWLTMQSALPFTLLVSAGLGRLRRGIGSGPQPPEGTGGGELTGCGGNDPANLRPCSRRTPS